MAQVTIYGATWCEDTQQVLGYLDGRGIDYDFRDLDENLDDVVEFKRLNDEAGISERLFPTILIGGKLLSGPSLDELADALQRA